MAHVITKDPFGFVGSHVVQRRSTRPRPRPRARTRRRQRGASSGDGEGEHVLHGWLTRYDMKLDAYTLFLPGELATEPLPRAGGQATAATSTTTSTASIVRYSSQTLHSRGEVMKFISSADFQLRREPEEGMPPPLEDHTSRFMGAYVNKTYVTRLARQRARAEAAENGEGDDEDEDEDEDEEMAMAMDAEEGVGRVVAFLPFADRFHVQFNDGSTMDVSQEDVIDNLLARVRALEDMQSRGAVGTTAVAGATSGGGASITRKRRRAESWSNADDGASVHEDDDETEDEATGNEDDEHPHQLEKQFRGVRVKAEPVASVGGNDTAARGREEAGGSIGSDDEPMAIHAAHEYDDTPLGTTPIVVDPPVVAVVKKETSAETPIEVDVDGDDDEPMEDLIPLDDDEGSAHVNADGCDDYGDNARVQALRSMNKGLPRANTSTTHPDISIISLLEDEGTTTPSRANRLHASPSPPSPSPSSMTARPSGFYVVDATPPAAVAPMEKRTLAFEWLRSQLQKLLEADELHDQLSRAAATTTLLSALLSDHDIKARDAVRRFVDTGGFVAINHILTKYLTDRLHTSAECYTRVLFLLKVVAMLPTPSQRQVVESKIGKAIGRLIKSRRTDQEPDALMPRCIPQLAKWVKNKWLANMKRDGTGTEATTATRSSTQTPQRAGQPPQRRSGGAPFTPSFASRQQQQQDTEPIPRIPKRTTTAAGTKSSLKPDWMRQTEALQRSRFRAGSDARAEFEHYKQNHRSSSAASNASGRAAAAAAGAAAAGDTAASSTFTSTTPPVASRGRNAPPLRENDIPGGLRGVFGRSQRLGFGAKWSVCEFFKDTPPVAVRRFTSGSVGSASSGGLPRPARTIRPKRPILKRMSRYQGDLNKYT